MSVRLHSEIRSIGPLVLVACALLAATALLPNEEWRLHAAIWVFTLACGVIGVAVFGTELLNGTCPFLFGQPVPRRVIWRHKLVAQGMALVAVSLLFALSTASLHSTTSAFLGGNFHDLLEKSTTTWLLLAPLVALGGGSLAVLLLRNVPGAFALVMIGAIISFHAGAELIPVGIIGAIGGQLLFRQLLERFENYSSVAAELHFSAIGGKAATRPRGRCWSLITKEVALQQISFIAIAAAILLPLIVWKILELISAKRPDFDLASGFAGNFILFGAPALIGAAAVLEERRKGIYLWQSVLPPSRRAQWLVKMSLAMVLSIGVGMVALYTMAPGTFTDADMRFMKHEQPWVYPLYAFVITLFSALIASTARDYIGAVLRCGALVLAVFGLYAAAIYLIGSLRWTYPFMMLLWTSVPILLAYALLQGFRNMNSIESDRKLLLQTIGGVSLRVVLASVVAALLYHRTWEWFESYQPRETRTFDVDRMQEFVEAMPYGAAIDPQGGLWRVNHFGGMSMPELERIGNDSDWRQIRHVSEYGFLALKADGSLWGETLPTAKDFKWRFPLPKTFAQVDSGNRWQKIDFNGVRVLALRDDGTLWMWGNNHLGNFGSTNFDLTVPEPRQVGSDSDWLDIMPRERTRNKSNFALKSDGQLYHWGEVAQDHFEPEPTPIPYFAGLKVKHARHSLWFLLATLEDGRQVMPARDRWWDWELYTRPFPGRPELAILDERLDMDRIPLIEEPFLIGVTRANRLINNDYYSRLFHRWFVSLDWLAVDLAEDWSNVASRSDSQIVAVKRDGSLWLAGHPIQEFDKTKLLPDRFRPQLVGYLPDEFFERKDAR